MPLHRVPYLLIPTLLFVLLAIPAHANFKDALDAYKQGDYAVALKEWRALAEQGDALAQTMLASMFAQGQGVTADSQMAVYWYWRAAEQGDDLGQLLLGVHYFYGKGIRQDYSEAHKWLSLSAAQGNARAIEFMERAEEKMRARQINDRPTDRQPHIYS